MLKRQTQNITKNIFQFFIKNKYFFIALTLIFFSVVVMSMLFSKTPSKTIYHFLFGFLQNKYSFGNMLNTTSTFIFAALGISIVFHMNFFNLGGEGQIYAGGFIAAIFLIAFPNLNAGVGIVLASLCAIFVSGMLCMIAAFLNIKFGVQDLIGTYLLSRAVILIINYFITGVFYDRASNLLTTEKISLQFRLTKILPPSYLNTGIFLGLFLAIGMYIYLYRMRFGYETRISGKNKMFAKYAGVPVARYTMLAAFISGALHGLGGAVSVMGTNYAAVKEFSSGIGFSAIAISIIAKNNPLAIIPSALFFAYIDAGAKSASLNSDVSVEMAIVLQALIFLFVTVETLPNIFRRGKKVFV